MRKAERDRKRRAVQAEFWVASLRWRLQQLQVFKDANRYW